MLEHYIEKKLAAMKRNYLAPYLEKIADRYYTDGYSFLYARASLGHAFRFAEWLEAAHVPPGKITARHVDKYLRRFAPAPPGKRALWQQKASVAARRVLRLIRAEHFPACPSQVEVDRYVDHLRRNRCLAEGTVYLHRHYLVYPAQRSITYSSPFEPA